MNNLHNPLNNIMSALTYFHIVFELQARPSVHEIECLDTTKLVCVYMYVYIRAHAMYVVHKKNMPAYMGQTYCMDISKVIGRGRLCVCAVWYVSIDI